MGKKTFKWSEQSGKKSVKNFFCSAILDHFWAKMFPSETTSLHYWIFFLRQKLVLLTENFSVTERFSVTKTCFCDKNLFCQQYTFWAFHTWFPGKRFGNKWEIPLSRLIKIVTFWSPLNVIYEYVNIAKSYKFHFLLFKVILNIYRFNLEYLSFTLGQSSNSGTISQAIIAKVSS